MEVDHKQNLNDQVKINPEIPLNNIQASSCPKKSKKILFGTFVLFLILIGIAFYLYTFPVKKYVKKDQVIVPTIMPTGLLTHPPTPTVVESDISEAKGKIVFVSGSEIWSINSDKSNLKLLFKDETIKFHINLSSDGKKIAYAFFPKDQELGGYSGIISGLAFFDLETNENKILIPYENLQNYYPLWSPNNRYISIWVGGGTVSKLIDVSSGKILFDLRANDSKNAVSPIVFIPNSDKVSYVENGSLIVSNIDTSNKQVLATEVDAFEKQHEASNIPLPPEWSKSGRYVLFYSNGDLHLMDVINKTNILIQKGVYEEIFYDYLPGAYLIGFNFDETKIYLYNNVKSQNILVLDLVSGKSSELSIGGFSARISPDGQKILSRMSISSYIGNNIFDLLKDHLQECKGTFNYFFLNWGPAMGFVFRLNTWSPDSKGIIGYRDYGREGINILNINDCSVFTLLNDKEVSLGEAIWFPQKD